MRERVSLNGWWDWSVPNGPIEKKLVPSSYRCVGEAIFARRFDLPDLAGRRVFLCFEGVTFEGRATINGHELGRMLAFVPYEFDITPFVVVGANSLSVDVKDILAPYGPLVGWESYAGLIRNVYLELRSPAYIADSQWSTTLAADYRSADCVLNVWIEGAETGGDATVALTLSYGGQPVCVAEQALPAAAGRRALQFAFPVEQPHLWSPAAPNLYELRLELRQGGQSVDNLSQQVGVREFAVRGTRFYLNGEDTVLRGVCRHELWGSDQGHTLTREQMEQDMRLIKELGANYVRLVHYPHDRYIVELADRIGLMVSEEPMTWWSDFSNPTITEGALEDLRRIVLRDRNHPSVVFWLAWNECEFRGEYLVRARQICASLDPSRPVSAANCMRPPDTRVEYARARMDFYTEHPYGSYPDHVIHGYSIEQMLQVLNDKPVLFTEWGGFWMQDNPALTEQFGETFIHFARQRYPQPNLAGFSFWEWADMPEPVRNPPACRDGMLIEGLVDAWRHKRPLYDTMAGIFARLDGPAPAPPEPRLTLGSSAAAGHGMPLDLSALIATPGQAAQWEQALTRALEPRKRFLQSLRGPLMPQAITQLGALPVRIDAGRPLVLSQEVPSLSIPVGLPAAQVVFLGQVSLVGGYPLGGAYGEAVARYTLVYGDGSQQEVVLHNGLEIASAGTIYLHSRIDPRAARAPRVLHIQVDPDWKEAYQVCEFIVAADPRRRLERIEFALLNPAYAPLLYGVTIV